jgi:hypothetical protein
MIQFPAPIMGLYDLPMWESIRSSHMALQVCSHCGSFRYPPGPSCPQCLSPEAEWRCLSGKGIIFSWTVFHRQYFDAYPPPHNSIVVSLEEGIMMVSTLEGAVPDGNWIGHAVTIGYKQDDTGATLPIFRLTGSS